MDTTEYLRRIEANLRNGNATEQTHRAALADFVDGIAPGTEIKSLITQVDARIPYWPSRGDEVDTT